MLAEAARIAKPGASIGIFDGDYASLTFGHPDSDQGKRDDEALIAAIVTNPRVMREMPVLAREAGLELVASFPYVLAEVGKADFWLPAIESFRRLMPTAGAMTEAEANAWADRLLQASESASSSAPATTTATSCASPRTTRGPAFAGPIVAAVALRVRDDVDSASCSASVGAPTSLTTWSIVPWFVIDSVRMSCSFTPGVTGTSKARLAWIVGFDVEEAVAAEPPALVGLAPQSATL